MNWDKLLKCPALTLNHAGFSIVAEAGEGCLWGFPVLSTPHDSELRAHFGDRLLTYHLPSVTPDQVMLSNDTSHALHYKEGISLPIQALKNSYIPTNAELHLEPVCVNTK